MANFAKAHGIENAYQETAKDCLFYNSFNWAMFPVCENLEAYTAKSKKVFYN